MKKTSMEIITSIRQYEELIGMDKLMSIKESLYGGSSNTNEHLKSLIYTN